MLLGADYESQERSLQLVLNGRDPRNREVRVHVADRMAILWRKESWETLRQMGARLGVGFIDASMTFDELAGQVARNWLRLLAQRQKAFQLGDIVKFGTPEQQEGKIVGLNDDVLLVEHTTVTRTWVNVVDAEKA